MLNLLGKDGFFPSHEPPQYDRQKPTSTLIRDNTFHMMLLTGCVYCVAAVIKMHLMDIFLSFCWGLQYRVRSASGRRHSRHSSSEINLQTRGRKRSELCWFGPLQFTYTRSLSCLCWTTAYNWTRIRNSNSHGHVQSSQHTSWCSFYFHLQSSRESSSFTGGNLQ